MKRRYKKNSLEEVAVVTGICSIIATTVAIVPAIVFTTNITALHTIILLNIIIAPVIMTNIFTYSVAIVKCKDLEVGYIFVDCLKSALKVLWFALIPLLIGRIAIAVILLFGLTLLMIVILFPLKFTIVISKRFNLFK